MHVPRLPQIAYIVQFDALCLEHYIPKFSSGDPLDLQICFSNPLQSYSMIVTRVFPCSSLMTHQVSSLGNPYRMDRRARASLKKKLTAKVRPQVLYFFHHFSRKP
ncbi:hypothetical protein CIPAW_07G195400 [Carya illinoinensis]|uniref:Uncharacterized protein n=1 Tax=Carya illinoinensis TaxID=32201 RepID=A0A8T1Q6E0_CARIL|nr:hypothetical protein CIPAW_07G195400 [Carya illinoinensis]